MPVYEYYLDYYDAFDGWIGSPIEGWVTNDLAEAKARCNERNAKRDSGNISCGEHYSVVRRNLNSQAVEVVYP